LHAADEHLATAMTLYGDMDMQFWLEKARAENEASQRCGRLLLA